MTHQSRHLVPSSIHIKAWLVEIAARQAEKSSIEGGCLGLLVGRIMPEDIVCQWLAMIPMHCCRFLRNVLGPIGAVHFYCLHLEWVLHIQGPRRFWSWWGQCGRPCMLVSGTPRASLIGWVASWNSHLQLDHKIIHGTVILQAPQIVVNRLKGSLFLSMWMWHDKKCLGAHQRSVGIISACLLSNIQISQGWSQWWVYSQSLACSGRSNPWGRWRSGNLVAM